MLPEEFYKKVEQPNYLKHVLYSDTDSVYLCIPYDTKSASIDQQWNECVRLSKDINQTIRNYLNEHVFPLSNLNPTFNKTDFKTEALIDSIVFLPETKKYYAYKLLVDEGKFLESAKIKYKNIGIKSNSAKLSSRILHDILDNIVLNSEVSSKLERANEAIKSWFEFYKKCIVNYEFIDIGMPVKWSKAAQTINAMRVYNIIANEKVFVPGSAGVTFYCQFKNPNIFTQYDANIDLKNLNMLAVPYNYNTEFLKEKMEAFNIEFDVQEHWDRCIFTTTCHKVIQTVK